MQIENSKSLEKAMFIGWLRSPYDPKGKTPSQILTEMMATSVETPEGNITATEAIIASYIAKAMRGNTAAADKLLGMLDHAWRPEVAQNNQHTINIAASVALQPAVNMILEQAGYSTETAIGHQNPETIEQATQDGGSTEQKHALAQQLGL